MRKRPGVVRGQQMFGIWKADKRVLVDWQSGDRPELSACRREATKKPTETCCVSPGKLREAKASGWESSRDRMGQPPGQLIVICISSVYLFIPYRTIGYSPLLEQEECLLSNKQTQRGGELPERTGWRGQEEIKKMVKVGVGNSDTKSISCPPGKEGKDFLLKKLKALRQTMIRHWHLGAHLPERWLDAQSPWSFVHHPTSPNLYWASSELFHALRLSMTRQPKFLRLLRTSFLIKNEYEKLIWRYQKQCSCHPHTQTHMKTEQNKVNFLRGRRERSITKRDDQIKKELLEMKNKVARFKK